MSAKKVRSGPETAETADAGGGGSVNRLEFARRTMIVAAIGLMTYGLAAAFERASDVFFTFFLSVLLAILIRSLSDGLGRLTGVGQPWSFALVVGSLALFAVVGIAILGTTVAAQVSQLSGNLPASVETMRAYLAERGWGQHLLRALPTAAEVFPSAGMGPRLMGYFSATLGVAGVFVVILFLTLYLAAEPRLYTEGLLTLVPPRRRERGREVLSAIAHHLRWWMIGRLIAVVAVALMVTAGLWALGVPEYLVLGLIAGGLVVIPYIGSFFGSVPGVLVAFLQGPETAIWAVGLYVVVQSVENYLITPLVQSKTVNLPPVVAIGAIALAGSLFGITALAIATPLAVTIMVLVKTLYVEDALGEPMDVYEKFRGRS